MWVITRKLTDDLFRFIKSIYRKHGIENELPRHRVERSFGHPKSERKHEGVIVRIDEHSRIGQTFFVWGLDADSKDHIVPRRYGQLPGHVGKICPLKYLSFVAFFDAHQFDERAGQVRAPSVQVDGDRVLVEYGEIMVAFFAHAERPKINNLLARRTRKELQKKLKLRGTVKALVLNVQ